MRKYIVLEFTLYPEINMMNDLASEQLKMVKWCRARRMENEIMELPTQFLKVCRVKFYRDKNTYDFIKEFLEFKVGYALPYESLQSIPNVRIL